MMGALDRYLLKRLIGTFAIVLLAVVGLAATLDLLANASEAIANSDNESGLGTYILARLPLIILKVAPIVALLAALITLLGLTRTGELGAAAALGASQGRTARAMLPAAILLGGIVFMLAEFAAPPGAAKLRAMGLDPFAKLAQPSNALWLRENTDIIRIGRISADENHLSDVTIFRRDTGGRLAYEVRAQSADRQGAGWRLKNVDMFTVSNSSVQRGNAMNWPSPLGPKSFKILAAHPQELALGSIKALAKLPGASPRPPYYYDLWVHRKYAMPISAALMMLLAIPFAGRLARGRSLGAPLAAGLILGFGYFVFVNLATAAAETGAIAPMAGAWGPPAALAFAILALAIFQEKPG
jgi:lipopolysaccharide export system permease protein